MEKMYFQYIRLSVKIFALNVWRKLLVKSLNIRREKLLLVTYSADEVFEKAVCKMLYKLSMEPSAKFYIIL